MAHWRIVRRLGEGGSGQVFLARHPTDGEAAVKVLADRSQTSLLEQEAKLLVRLRHPGIAAFLGYRKDSSEIFGEDRGPCFWMEYVAGDDVSAAAAKLAPAERKARAFEWFAQALEALAYLHSQDVLHGDLSPGNLRIDAQGRLRLIDFGMASVGREGKAGRAATLLYLAPERIGGKNSPACDLFSLGTIFYEILAGTHPRTGCRSLREMTARPVRPLAEAVPGLSPAETVAARVIDRMVVADLKERFSSAAEALEALSGGAKTASPKSEERFYPLSLLEAEEPLRKIGETFESGESGKSRFFALHGITGVGKKRFLRESLFQAALAGLAVTEIPAASFPPLKEGLEPLRTPGATAFRDLEDVPLEALSPLLHLRRADLPASGTFVILQWNDDRLDEGRARFLGRLLRHPDVEELALSNLSREGSRALFEAALGNPSDLQDQETMNGVYDRTNGNPLMILELAALMRGRKTAVPGDLSSVGDVLAQRIAELGERDRECLNLLAAAREPVEFDDLVRLLKLEDAVPLLVLLEGLASRGFAVCDPGTGRYRLAASGLERRLLEKLPSSARSALHRRWFDLLKDATDPNIQKAHQALELKEIGAVAACVRPAAEELFRVGRKEDALAWAERGAAVLEGTAETAALSRLLRLKANILIDLGRFQDALAACERVMEFRAPDEPMSLKTAKYWMVTGLMHQNLGNNDEADRRFRQCLETSLVSARAGESGMDHYIVRSYSLLGLQSLHRGERAQARDFFEKALASDPEGGRRRAEILRNLAIALSQEKDWDGVARALEESKQIYRGEKDAGGEFADWLLEGNLAMERDRPDQAGLAYAEAEKLAASRKDDLLLATVWNNEGVLDRQRGNLEAAYEKIQKSLEIFRAMGNLNDLADSLRIQAVIESQCGRFERAEAALEEMRALIPRLPQASEKAADAESALKEYRDGERPPLTGALETLNASPDGDWNVELLLRRLTRGTDGGALIQKILKEVFEKLPNRLKVSFVDRADYKRWVLGRKD